MADDAELVGGNGDVTVAHLHTSENLQRGFQVSSETGMIRLEATLGIRCSNGDAPASQVAQGLAVIIGTLHPVMAESHTGDAFTFGRHKDLAGQAGVPKITFHDPVRATLGQFAELLQLRRHEEQDTALNCLGGAGSFAEVPTEVLVRSEV